MSLPPLASPAPTDGAPPVALPQALQDQINELQAAQPQGQQPNAQPQGQMQGQQPNAQPQGQQPSVDPMTDAELAQFFVDDTPPQTHGFNGQQPAQQQPYQGHQQPPYQTHQPAPYQQGGYQGTQPVPTIDPAQLTRIEQAQRAMFEALQANNAGAQQANNPAAQTGAAQTGAGQGVPELNIEFNVEDLTEDERKFFQGREQMFGKLFQRFAKDTLEPHLKRLAEAQQQTYGRVTEFERNQQAQQQQSIRQLISARVPDFEQLLAQPQFRQFMQEHVQDVGVSRGEIIRAAAQRGDIGLISHHVTQYKQRQGGVPDGSQVAQTMQQPQGMPRSPQVGSPTRQAKRVTDETLMAAEAEMMKGRLAPDKFEKLIAIYKSQNAQQPAAMQRSYRMG